jgi:glycosyltransferase involved in cell wall biosynthesis
VLLETVRWFKRRTNLNVRILLLGFGHLTSDFAAAGKCYTSVNLDKDYLDIVDYLLDDTPPKIVYCNTVVSGRLFQSNFARFLKGSQVVAHCHEMANVLREFPGQLCALVARADRWICASPAIPPYLQAECNVPAERIGTVLPFIEPSTISTPALPLYRSATRTALGISLEAFVVVGCGTVNFRKGPDIFVDVAEELLRNVATTPIHFVWIGDGEDKEALELVVRDKQLGSSVSFLGYRKDSADLIGIGDVLFLSSREDPFPLVVLEAAQFGIPSVCFREGVGIADFVGAGRGLVCRDRSVIAAASALEKLLLDRELREKLGKEAQLSVTTHHFSMSAMRKILGEIRDLGLPPAVSIIVPNYNHENYLDQRLQSIIHQTIEDYEIIVLDDCSTDQSMARIRPYLSDSRFRLAINERNSGSVFEQWRKGIDLATADVVWIAESDDFCELDFLERLLPAMTDPDVNIAFARTRIVNEAGDLQVGAIRPYMERFSPGFGLEDFKSSGPQFVNDGFGALCAIVNASGALLRKSVTRNALFTAKQFKVCGDWRVYLECCRSGSVYYTSQTTNYFRRHGLSTVHKMEGTDQYFSERLSIAECVVQNFWTTKLLLRKMQSEILNEISRFNGRFDPSFRGLGNEITTRTHNQRYVKQEVHVCFYVHGLLISKGGIERLFALIASALADRGYKISVICRPATGKAPVYPLRHGIEVVPIDVTTEAGSQELRSFLLLNCVDVLVPMLSEALFEQVVGATRNLAIPVIASEHNDPWVIEEKWWDTVRRRETFAECRTIHLLSEQFRISLPNSLRSRIRVIPNPVTPGFFGCTRRPGNRRRVIAVGRLAHQKHFEILIEAFSYLVGRFREWDLVIFGEGELRQDLEGMLNRYDLLGRASLPGLSDRLAQEMEFSDVIVMPSRFEGFGMALVEGMAAGLPGVAFADCNGPNEIILDGENGLLVHNRTSQALAEVLQRLLGDEDLRAKLGARARGVALKYSLRSVVDEWEQMIAIDCGLR